MNPISDLVASLAERHPYVALCLIAVRIHSDIIEQSQQRKATTQ